MSVVFWDVDTQVDFLDPDGTMVVARAGEIRPRLAELTRYARERGIRIVGSVEYHHPDDEELAAIPDVGEYFPEHAIRGTPGVEKIPETAPLDPWWVESVPWPSTAVAEEARRHRGEIYFRKNRFDVFSNPNVDSVLEALAPVVIVVYGAIMELGIRWTVEGLGARQFAIAVVEDAIGARDPVRAAALASEWEKKGVRRVTADALIQGVATL